MSVQLFAKLQDGQTFVNLDLSANEPIKMVLSVQNIEEPLATNSTFSRTFKVPHTGVNGPYFKGVFNVNSVDFDASKRADAYILDNGQFFANGQIILNSVYRNEKEKNVEYEITFLGETSDFGAKIGGGFMNQINMNHLNHAKTYDNITQSWFGNLFNGDIVYGLIEWGYTYDANNQPIQPTISSGFAKSFTTGPNALRLSQWKPQYRAKALWDQVFKEAGYTYDSTFLESTLFKQLYIISDNVSSAELNTANTFKVDGGSGGNYTNDSFQIPYGTEVSDPSNNFSLVTNAFSVPITGQYTFYFEALAALGSYYQNNSSEANGSIEWYDQTGTVVASIGFSCYNQGNDGWSQNNPTTSIVDYTTVNLNAGDVIKTRCVVGPGQPYVSDNFGLYNAVWECTSAPQVLAATGILPANIKKIDFMKSIINRFRLVFVPSKDIQNHFTITPWKDWILEGTVRDWTSKLDGSKDLKIRPLFQGQSRFQVYKDQEDADYLNYNYQLTYKQSYGQLNFDSNNELLTGSKEYKDSFAPTPIAPIGFKEGDVAGSQFLIPHIAKDTGGSEDSVGTSVISGKREPIQPKLRLVFYDGLVTAPVVWWMAETDDNSVRSQKTVYPLMSSFSTWPITPSTLDLNWKNSDPFWKITDPLLGPGTTANSCYNVYWKTWNDQVFDPYSRIVDANITLDYQDVLDLKFNDYIFLKDSWYVVNKITDYIPGQTTNCRVELVKLGNIGVTIPYVSPIVYVPIQLCYSATATPCQIFCCNNEVTVNSTYYIEEGYTYSGATRLFLDQNGSLPAPAGIYSNGVQINEYDGTGILIATYNPEDCNCNPVNYSFNLIKSKTPCGLCCGDGGSSVVAYGLNPTWGANTLLWLDSNLTIPIPNGWYTDGTLGVVYQYLNGAITVAYNCETCNCLELALYPHTVRFSTDLCRACRCGTISNVWTDSAVWNTSTVIYSNNIGTIPAGTGFYNKDGWYLQTNGTAAVVDSGTCPSCLPCKPKIDILIELDVLQAGYTTAVTLESSDDNGVNWTTEGVVSITPSDSVTTKTETLSVGIGGIFRLISVTDTVGGSMEAILVVNDSAETNKVLTPGTIRSNYDVQVLETDVLSFTCNVDGGEVVVTDDNLLVSGSFVSYQGDTNHKGAIALTNTAAVNTSIDFTSGFTNSGGLATCKSIIKIGSIIVVSGIFNEYKGSSLTSLGGRNNVVGLNLDGTFNTSFNANLVTGLGTLDGNFKLTYIDETKFVLWTLDNTPIDIDMVIIDNTGTFVVGVGDEFGPTGFNSNIESVSYYNNALYVIGNFGLYQSPTNVLTFQAKIVKLDLDLENDPSFDPGTGISGVPVDIEVTSTGIYVITTGTYNGTTITGKLCRINQDGSLDTTFLSNIGNGPDSSITAIQVDVDGIWTIGNFTSWNGVSGRYDIVRLNLDGTYNSDFDNSTPFDPAPIYGTVLMDCKLSQDSLYVFGDFDTYKTIQSDGLIKLDKFTGAVDTTFAVGTGFATNPGSTNKVLDVFIYRTFVPPTLYLINTSYSAESPCVAFCNTAYATPVYSNASSLINATILYADALGTTYPPAGYYATGNTIAQVDGNGIIIAFYDIALCNCNNLYEYNVDFDIDRCISCGTTGTPYFETVYGSNETWSLNSILYTNPAGTLFALPGFYTYAGGIVLEVGDNGIVISAFDCAEVCPTLDGDCRAVSVINNSPGAIYVYFRRCEGCIPDLYDSLYLPYGEESDLGGLVVYGSVSTTGKSKIFYGANC